MSGRTEGGATECDLSRCLHDQIPPPPLRHHAARRPADAGHRLLGRGQDRHRGHAGRVRHRLCRGRLSGRQPDRHCLLRREAHQARGVRRLRNDKARRCVGLERSRPGDPAAVEGRCRVLRGQELGLSRAAGAGLHERGEPRRDPHLGRGHRVVWQGGDGRLRALLRRLQGQPGLCAGLRRCGAGSGRAMGGAVRHQWRHAAGGGAQDRR
jgi:hypothetical protein